jgi:hypothetical protein
MAQHETMTVPKPRPDQVIIAACAEDGAKAWVVGTKGTLCDPEFLAQLEPLLAEAQDKLRERKAEEAGT